MRNGVSSLNYDERHERSLAGCARYETISCQTECRHNMSIHSCSSVFTHKHDRDRFSICPPVSYKSTLFRDYLFGTQISDGNGIGYATKVLVNCFHQICEKGDIVICFKVVLILISICVTTSNANIVIIAQRHRFSTTKTKYVPFNSFELSTS